MSERKYRHRGYQDSGDRDEKRRAPSADEVRRRLDGAPGGRSVGREATTVFKCAGCGERIRALDELGPSSTCPSCQADIHTCSHCAGYDPASRLECARPIAARIAQKTTRNDCPLFSPRVTIDLTGAKPQTADDARAAFDRLFKK